MNEEALFATALAMSRPEERQAFLAEACAGNTERLARVAELLHAHEHPDSFLTPPAAEIDFKFATQVPDGPGTVIGAYKLLEQIGEGGFGVVFMAEQQQPVRRKVAVKVLKPGMDTRQVVARFEAERQALALMSHPNIAQVLDGGQSASGRPFFVMELVRGVPITQYCDENNHTIDERLALFVTVCQAVQHAHQKGIIHRDLKPSNIMVSPHDAVPVVKVIDFGIAKATGQQLTDKTLYTNFAQFIGSPLYMSPEQAQLNGMDIDTRTDIYALGVLLYELLTGTTPFDAERLRKAGYDEIRRIIREEEPPKPSTRLSTMGQTAKTLVTQRQGDAKRLRRLFRSELDWIVMKALDKDRNRRYETADAFAADVQRYLHHEPVQACPPTNGYRMRKFLQRKRGPVMAASLLLLALVGGMVGTSLALVRAIRAEGEAIEEAQQRENALKDKERALAAAQQSERNAKDQLFGALLNQARALRFGGQAGQRFNSVKALAEAADIARVREYGAAEYLKLRSEAATCLALPDLRFERTLLHNLEETVPHRYWIAFDPLFHHFVYADRQGNISVRRVADAKETARLPGPDASPKWISLRFSPDGRWLQVKHEFADRPSQIARWEFADGKLGRSIVLDRWCEFSPDSRFAAGAGADGAVAIYEVASGREIKRIGAGMGAAGVQFHPDGRQLTVWFEPDRGRIAVLDCESGKEVAPYEHPQPGVGALSWRGDGRLLAVSCHDQRIYVWDHAKKEMQSVLEGHMSRGVSVQFSHAGDFLISTSWDGTTRLWDPVSGQQLVREPGSHFVAIRRDDRQVALLKNGHLELWEVAGGWECRTLHHGLIGNRTPRPADGPWCVDFSPDGQLLASGGRDGAWLWDLATFSEAAHVPAGPTAYTLIHPDGDSLFTYGVGGLQRWPIRRPTRRTPDHADTSRAVQVGPPQALDVPGNWDYAYLSRDQRGHRLSAVDRLHGRAIVLDLDNPGAKLVLEHPRVAGCWLSPDGRWAVTWSPMARTTKVWETSKGKSVEWQLPAGEVFQFFTPDGCWLVSKASGDAPMRMWRLGSWQPGPTLPKHGRTSIGFVPSPDGALLLGLGGGVEPPRLIHTLTGTVLAALAPPRDEGSASTRFSPDGTRLAVATGHHTIHVWDLRAVRRGLAELRLDWDMPP